MGNTVSDTLVAILEREPDWKALPPGVPPSILRLLRRCLTKDVRKRLQHIGDARLELEEPDPGPDAPARPGKAAGARLPWFSAVRSSSP